MALKVGIQLFSVRDEMAKDPIECIKKVAEIGYKYLEVANPRADEDPGCGFGMTPDELLKALDGTGAKIISGHIRPITEETLPGIIEWHKAVGNTVVGQSMAMYDSLENVLEMCKYYNAMGKKLAENGMKFLFHNHYHEFVKIGDKTIYDIIIENTDPEYVTFELDTFWAMRGGEDPIALIKKLNGRLFAIHQKDFSKTAVFDHNINLLANSKDKPVTTREDFMAAGQKPTDFCEVGTGIMPIQEILDAANEAGAEYVILEQDHTQLGQLESIKLSMEAFHNYSGVVFE
ncbi:MAG: sugar phosphate isomerase/epimerase [Clostridia bacterium]|nr:sugar phosphate isomerase/epimerase [Clostridia bacterium]